MKQSSKVGVVWFRQDLRTNDNPALAHAVAECDELFLLFIDDPAIGTVSSVGAASQAWLHHSLLDLARSLKDKGLTLHCAKGSSGKMLRDVMSLCGATDLYWNRCYDPVSVERDTGLKTSLSDSYRVHSFNASLLFEPFEVLKADDTPYRVFTPFWKMLQPRFPVDQPKALSRKLPPDIVLPAKAQSKLSAFCFSDIDKLQLLPEKDWHLNLMSHWKVGEKAALAKLKKFLKKDVHDYQEQRDIPSKAGTSFLSSHLHFGEIGPRQIVKHTLRGRSLDEISNGELVFVKEVVWREFAHSLIFHFPHTVSEPLDKRFQRFPWAKKTETHFSAWCKGQTGVPIVDAGMRQLYATGWMHNRVRMIVGSYLIKNLLIPWQQGEQWFRDTLVDADVASNVMGWQWCAGSGADAAPFFRIFNPVLQGEKFDKSGDYVRQWVPELAHIENKFIHKPWELTDIERAALDYPMPLVDLKESRNRALEAFASIKQ